MCRGGGGGSAEGTGGAKLNSEISDPVIRKGGASVAHKQLINEVNTVHSQDGLHQTFPHCQ